MNVNFSSVGSILAIVVLILAIVLFAIGKLDVLPAIMFGLLAVARLL